MKTLEKIRAQFGGKDRSGHRVNILAYHSGQEYPIIAEVKYGGGWVPSQYAEDGTLIGGKLLSCNLVKKHPHLPKDILCEVWNSSAEKYKRYSSGDGKFFRDGATSLIEEENLISWDSYRVIENEPKPWFGGECPIPDGCEFRVLIRGKWHDPKVNQVLFYWERVDHITAYQILGEKESK